jgi:DNA polymerase-3 subunit delta'
MIPVTDWHPQQWQQLQARRQQGQLPHAMLFTGESGIGKAEFALQFARSLLCEQPDTLGHACQQCASCQRFNAGTHPDLIRVEPEEAGKPIKVDQIRQIIGDMTLASHYGGYRVLLMDPADAMNSNAANSFLKTLEEPPANSVLLLVSAMPSRLPATIRSRCQILRFAVPAVELVKDWLRMQQSVDDQELQAALHLSAGAPRLAQQYLQQGWLEQRQSLLQNLVALARGKLNPATVAAQLLKQDRHLPIHWLYDWIADLIRLANNNKNIKNKDLESDLQNISKQVDLRQLHALLDKVQQADRLADTSLNQQMLWEDLLIDWLGLFTDHRAQGTR